MFGLIPSFTTEYKMCLLVYDEAYGHVNEVMSRKKHIKNLRRVWRIKLIEPGNWCCGDTWPHTYN